MTINKMSNIPTESGVFLVTIISRDHIPIPKIMYFNSDTNECITSHISEYGYASYNNTLQWEDIYSFMKIDEESFSYIYVPPTPFIVKPLINGSEDIE